MTSSTPIDRGMAGLHRAFATSVLDVTLRSFALAKEGELCQNLIHKEIDALGKKLPDSVRRAREEDDLNDGMPDALVVQLCKHRTKEYLERYAAVEKILYEKIKDQKLIDDLSFVAKGLLLQDDPLIDLFIQNQSDLEIFFVAAQQKARDLRIFKERHGIPVS